MIPSRVMIIMPTPLPCLLEEPSTNISHRGIDSVDKLVTLGLEHSAMKSTIVWHLIEALGLKWISYSLNSIAHLISLSADLGFWSTCLRGWLVKTMIGCYQKYSLSFLDVMIRLRPSFSISGYLVSRSVMLLLT